MYGENFKVRILLSLKNLDSFVGKKCASKVMNICKEYFIIKNHKKFHVIRTLSL